MGDVGILDRNVGCQLTIRQIPYWNYFSNQDIKLRLKGISRKVFIKLPVQSQILVKTHQWPIKTLHLHQISKLQYLIWKRRLDNERGGGECVNKLLYENASAEAICENAMTNSSDMIKVRFLPQSQFFFFWKFPQKCVSGDITNTTSVLGCSNFGIFWIFLVAKEYRLCLYVESHKNQKLKS